MDISLKGDMDGIDTVKEIRKISDAPVIYISGISCKRKYKNSQKTNIIDFLSKPVRGDDLIVPLQKVVDAINNYRVMA